MKKISQHLGEVIVALAGVALLIAAITLFKTPIGGFFDNIIDKELSVGNKVLAGFEDVNVTPNTGGGGTGGASEEEIVWACLSTMSWSEVETIANNGTAEAYFNNDDTSVAEHNCMKNGCTIDVVVNYGSSTERGEAHIVGFNHDTLADGSRNAAITFSFVDALAVRSPWNSNGSNEGGWEASEVRATMSAWTLQDINGNAINVASVIKSTYDRYTINGNKYTSTTDVLWLFSEKEICGYTYEDVDGTTALDGTRFIYSYPDEYSTQYEYYQYLWPNRVANTTWNRQGEGNTSGSLFDDTIPSLYKAEGSGSSSAAWWWLRSASVSSSDRACTVESDGRTGSDFDHCDITWAECIVPGFCIG